MKRYVIGAVFALCIFLCGCSSKYDETAIQAFGDALAAAQDVSGMNMDIKVLAYEDLKQERLMTKMTINGAILKQDDDIQMSMEAALAAKGISFGKLNFYLKDAGMYVDMLGTKAKIPLGSDIPNLSELVNLKANIEKEQVEQSIKENMKEFRYEDQENGMIAFSFQDSFIKDKMNAYSKNGDASIQRFDGTLTIKDNHITAYTFQIDIDTEEQPLSMVITIECSDFDQIKELTFPDFSEYTVQDDFDVSEGM